MTTFISKSFTRPADTTAYAAGDLVSTAVTAAAVSSLEFPLTIPSGKDAYLDRVRIHKSGTATANASFALKLYGSTVSGIANGDNGAWSTNRSNYIGSVTVAVDTAFVDGAAGVDPVANEANIPTLLRPTTGGSVFGLLTATAAYTPASEEVFTVTLEVSAE